MPPLNDAKTFTACLAAMTLDAFPTLGLRYSNAVPCRVCDRCKAHKAGGK